MSAVVIVGAQWGDEGKGKIVDIYTEHADMVVRYGGGPNAGHTLVVGDEKIVVRLIPSGILRPETTCVLAQGMVIDAAKLLGEIDELVSRGKLSQKALDDGKSLVVSDRAHAILPYHILIDGLREQTAGAIGTTKRGVGPCYEDKAARRGIPLGAFRDLAKTEALVQSALQSWAPVITALGGVVPSVSEVMAEVKKVAPRIVPLLTDTVRVVTDAVAAKKNVLFEGAQGTLLDIDHGTYPFVTSSNATAGGACTGTGVGPSRIHSVIGLTKAYCTRVGSGPFPTELHDATGERIRTVGAEFGAVTGRSRRVGWLDLPALKYAVRVNGLDGIALTKLDVLTGLSEVQVCTHYDVDGVRVSELSIDDIDRSKPVYRAFPGWVEDIAQARSIKELPKAARSYVEFVEQEAGCKVVLVSVGYRRDDTIVLSNPFG